MTNNYDGPSFYRHNVDPGAQPDPQKPTDGRRKPFKVTTVPAFKRFRSRKVYDYEKIVRHLRKQADDYYVVVPDDDPTDRETHNDNDQATLNDAHHHTVAHSQRRAADQALGHSLSDILKSEGQAQRELKLFNTKNKA